MKKYIAMAAMAAMMSENMVYMDAPSQKNRKANRKNRH